jgi:hypothetical protein
MTQPPLQLYDSWRGMQPLGDMWTMKKGQLELRCALSTHALRRELRLTVRGELSRSQVCKRPIDVFDTSDAWRAEATTKGWT